MTSDRGSDIAQKSVSGSAYSIAASGVTLTLGFLRATIMARLLLPEHFGVATLALFYANLAGQLREFGIDNAFIYRKEADQRDQATYFSMRLALILASMIVLVMLTPLLGRIHDDIALFTPVLLAYVSVSFLKGINSIQMTILSKRLAFRHLALTDVASSVTMTVVGPLMAWAGYGVWSIFGAQFSGLFVRALSIWIVYRSWRPRLGWDAEAAREYWRYGIRMWTGGNVSFLLDRFDDWWIGSFLGSSPLGLYSRAYEFAGYSRRVVANPILSVFFPTFAVLQDDRARLSRACFRTTSLIVRGGAFVSLLFIFTAPEFIRIFLGDRWLPMLFTFQLMIVYTLLDPLLVAASNLLAATGYPAIITRTRIVQMIVFVPSVFVLGSRYGINCVAVAANGMVLAGTLLLFYYSRRIVDYSPRTLWLWPLAALAFAAAVVLALGPIWDALPDWSSLILKAITIPIVFGGTLWLSEREQLLSGWGMIRGFIPRDLHRRSWH